MRGIRDLAPAHLLEVKPVRGGFQLGHERHERRRRSGGTLRCWIAVQQVVEHGHCLCPTQSSAIRRERISERIGSTQGGDIAINRSGAESAAGAVGVHDPARDLDARHLLTVTRVQRGCAAAGAWLRRVLATTASSLVAMGRAGANVPLHQVEGQLELMQWHSVTRAGCHVLDPGHDGVAGDRLRSGHW